MSSKPDPTTGETRGSGREYIAVLRNVHYAVDDKQVFSALDIALQRGHVTAIMGPSGTGKTTLLRLITGQLRADAGRVVVDGRDVAGLYGLTVSGLAEALSVSRQTTNTLLQALANDGLSELGFNRIRVLRPGLLLV